MTEDEIYQRWATDLSMTVYEVIRLTKSLSDERIAALEKERDTLLHFRAMSKRQAELIAALERDKSSARDLIDTLARAYTAASRHYAEIVKAGNDLVAAVEEADYESAYKGLVRDVIDALGGDPNDWDYEGSDDDLVPAVKKLTERVTDLNECLDQEIARGNALREAGNALADIVGRTCSHGYVWREWEAWKALVGALDA
jgi:hypothetical protein